MRTVFLGTSDFAASILQRLAAGAHRPQLVITRPDRPRGRGRRLAAPPVADAARALGLELLQPENVNDGQSLARIAAAEPEELVICAFGALIREPLLSEHPLLNVHPSLLPRWRGAAPVERAIMAGDGKTGVSIMRLTAGWDSGPVCLAGSEPIAPDDTYGTLALRLQELGADLLLRALDERPDFAEQPEEGVTYAEKIGPSDRTLDPGASAEVNDRVVRALSPHIGARVELADGSFLGVLRAAVRDPAAAGPLRAEGDGHLLLGGLELIEVQPAGGRPMDAAAYLRGRGLRSA
ncbi:MAG: methionyl-tRNA formyltransferase [Solirubrobacteraceae bacterium]|jgi:methionyl-tRNA formyltransferase|nr:methionyl-tRNA formyltransferase [Solirubrobacteraceae bacterium]